MNKHKRSIITSALKAMVEANEEARRQAWASSSSWAGDRVVKDAEAAERDFLDVLEDQLEIKL